MKIYGFMTDGLYKFKKGVYFGGLKYASCHRVENQTQEISLIQNMHLSL